MSALYLFRHAQAGLRHEYDILSELGQAQARALGEYLVSQRMRFTAVFSGGLERQKRTAQAVEQIYREAGLEFPEVTEDPLWNEFDLGAVYQALSPYLSRDDPAFKRDYDEMLRLIEGEDPDVHRNHNYCDIAVVRAWTEERYPYAGESWRSFRARILGNVERLSAYGSGEKVAVFTSATPIGVWMGHALNLEEQEIWRLAGVTYNSGMSTFQMKDRYLRLFSFNAVPHLPDPALWSFR